MDTNTCNRVVILLFLLSEAQILKLISSTARPPHFENQSFFRASQNSLNLPSVVRLKTVVVAIIIFKHAIPHICYQIYMFNERNINRYS